ncbi:MAG: DUF2849 domain-containing protein [Pseudomonadota bacterium]
MPKAFSPVVFTANDLIDGDSVYLGPDGWLRDIAGAVVATTPADSEALRMRAEEGVAGNLVIGPYDVAVTVEAGVPVPVKRRERIKASRATTMPVGIEALTALEGARAKAA